MNTKKLGLEPAFSYAHINPGMSKRYYTACMALQGILSNPKQDMSYLEAAKASFKMADVMLKQEKI